MRGKLWWAACLLLLFGVATAWALGGGGGGKIGSGGARTDTVNIELQNVPYVQQNIDTYYAGVGAEALTRSDSYCGLASAMMVRAMGLPLLEPRQLCPGDVGIRQAAEVQR